mgnify:CR=1 FL=1
MKRLSILLAFLLFAAPAFASTNPDDKSVTPNKLTEGVQPFTVEEVRAIEKRIMEIKDMDKSELSRDEKKALKKELREMRREIRERDEHHHRQGGIFISTGAIIVILLLIIIL